MQLKTARGRLFLFILVLLCLPALNSNLYFIHSAALYGVDLAPKPDFSIATWWDGSYQNKKSEFVNDDIGFRPDMIRVNNQVNYSFFNMAGGGVLMSRDHYLYYSDYVDDYCGTNYAGDNYFLETLKKLKRVQDTLEHLGKTFVWVYAASKASYFYDHLPGDLQCDGKGKTNINAHQRISDSLGIHYIDFNAWYVYLRNRVPHPLFSKQGIHWSLYGAMFAVDSIIRYIEKARNIQMPHPVITGMDISENARRVDNDLERVLNLVFPIDTAKYWYPVYHYNDDSTKTKPRVIYIGDSFIWTLLRDDIMSANTDPQFWYYFKEAFGTNLEKPVSSDMEHYNWPDALKKADCIVMLYTPQGLLKAKNGSGFIEKAYDYFYPSGK